MKRFQDEVFPYALFFVGLFAGLFDEVRLVIGIPIHEMGHVFAAFATGGYGGWDVVSWNQAITYGGNGVVIYAGGVFFELIFGTAVAAVLVMYRRATWLAGILFANGYQAAVWAHDQQDWSYLRHSYPAAERVVTQTLDIMMVVSLVIIVGAFTVSIAKRLHYLTHYTAVS